MRLLRVRFTVRRMIVVVAAMATITALAIQAGEWRRLSIAYRARAAVHAAGEATWSRWYQSEQAELPGEQRFLAGHESYCRQLRRGREQEAVRVGGSAPRPDEIERIAEEILTSTVERIKALEGSIERHRAMRDHEAVMRVKYEQAARYPWLPVAPDPPEPK